VLHRPISTKQNAQRTAKSTSVCCWHQTVEVLGLVVVVLTQTLGASLDAGEQNNATYRNSDHARNTGKRVGGNNKGTAAGNTKAETRR